MTALTLPAGPSRLPLLFDPDATVSDDGWLIRWFRAEPGLDGPPGILQGGLSVGVAIPAARLADRFGAPLTAVDARLHAPTPLGRDLEVRVRPTEAAARYAVETRDGDTLLVSAEVELAGRDPAPQVHDLVELATVSLPEPHAQDIFPTCWVCGPDNPRGLHLLPGFYRDDVIVTPFAADDDLGDDGGLDPLVVSAVLDCPTIWSAMRALPERGAIAGLLAGYHVRWFRDPPVMEPLRTVARRDGIDGRKIRARGAIVDEDGIVYATAAALHISVKQPPGTGATI